MNLVVEPTRSYRNPLLKNTTNHYFFEEGSKTTTPQNGLLIQIPLHRVFDDLRVDTGHSIDGVRANDAQVGHVDLLLFTLLDQGHAAQAVIIARVELGDALQEGWCEYITSLGKRLNSIVVHTQRCRV